MRKKIGIALGTGAARGLAHIGVLKAFDDENIPIDFVAGTSIGSLIGAAYCSGQLDLIEQFARSIDWKTIASYTDFVFPRQGLLQGNKIKSLMEELLPVETIEELSIPLSIVAADMLSGTECTFVSGNLSEAVRASISMPGIFEPVQWNDSYLVDGGIINPIPVSTAFDMGSDIVIAVDLLHNLEARNLAKKKVKSLRFFQKQRLDVKTNFKQHWAFKRLEAQVRKIDPSFQWGGSKEKEKIDETKTDLTPSIFDIMANSINIMSFQIAQANYVKCPPTHIIKPEMGYVGLFDYDQADELISLGYTKTIELLSSHPELYPSSTSISH